MKQPPDRRLAASGMASSKASVEPGEFQEVKGQE
jgi:hypothetical protein